MAQTLAEPEQVVEVMVRPEPPKKGWWAAAVPASTGPADLMPVPDDAGLVSRVIAAYQHAMSERDIRGNSMWQGIFNSHHQEIDAVFRKGDRVAATAILRDPSSSELFYGFDNLTRSMRDALAQPSSQACLAALSVELLLKFAEVSGAIAAFCPEQVNETRHKSACWQADAVLERIEEILGVPLHFPTPFPNEVGLASSRGIVAYRAVLALYQAWRVKELVRGIKNPRVLEIGAGLGRTADFARQFGVEDYTIIDLPLTAISQGYFLGRTLGEECVLLAGESADNASNRVKILSPKAFLDGTDSYDLVLNADSLTEIDPDIARAYMRRIASGSKMFLSINHECNLFTVRQLVRELDRVGSVHRHLHAMRQGYVEELVHF